MSKETLSCQSAVVEEGRCGSHDQFGDGSNGVRMPRLPKTLSADEKKYLLAVDRGDLATVRRIIQKSQREEGGVDINSVDSLGRGALLMAIEAENLDMVELLIVMGVRTDDALLHAIDKQFVEAVELLLEHEELVHQDGKPYSWESIDRDVATFTAEITPLMLASHRNNYEILKLLLDRGATLPLPHDIGCKCNECTVELREDSLRYSASRINSYKALASPSLIALTSTDPILTSFELSWELKRLAVSENEFRADYLELRKKCQDFAVELLTRTRTSHELDVMLNYDPSIMRDDDDSDCIHEYGLARLRLAIKYKQKKFIGHPWVQQLLATIWYDGLPGFRQKKTLGKCLEILRIVVTFPFYCFWYMIAPTSQTGKLMRKPFMKFLTHAASYLLFLLILILVSQRVEEQILEFIDRDKIGIDSTNEKLSSSRLKTFDFQMRQRGNPPQYLEYFIALYVLGFIVEETRELLREGFINYMHDMWNVLDFLRNFLYCAVACFRIWAYVEQQREIAIDPEKAFIPRENWDDFDPQLIAEGLFAAANVFSALKLVHVSTINPHLGPLQISLARMVYDILKFFFFYTLVLFAFSCGLNQLLWYFADLEREKCYTLPDGLPDWKNSPESCMKWRRFGNLFESSQTLFWTSFGMIGLSDFELTGIKSYTRFWGLLMFGTYSVINVIVLLNLLIAMLSNTYAGIAEEADTEWKFARTKLWLSYFDEDNTLPSPFNLVPTPKQTKRLLTRLFPRLAKCGKSSKHHEEKCAALSRQYTAVMRALVWRFVSGLQRRAEETQVTEDDINEVKGEVSALRCDLFEVFRLNGMNVSTKAERPAALGRKTREWKRRLLRGFHVAPAAGDETLVPMLHDDVKREDEGDNNFGQNSLHNVVIKTRKKKAESGADRFRRMARLALLNREHLLRSSRHLSHIGRSSSQESFKSRESLKRAMDEAKKQITVVESRVEETTEDSEHIQVHTTTTTLNSENETSDQSTRPIHQQQIQSDCPSQENDVDETRQNEPLSRTRSLDNVNIKIIKNPGTWF